MSVYVFGDWMAFFGAVLFVGICIGLYCGFARAEVLTREDEQ